MTNAVAEKAPKTGNSFGFELHRLVTSLPGNGFFSPYSVRVALGMVALGARGETRKIMADVLCCPESPEEQKASFGALVKEVNGDGKPREYELSTANALWRAREYTADEQYQQDLIKYYGGAVYSTNFTGDVPGAIRDINLWVAHETKDKIKELVNDQCINRETKLVLTNAIYFKGKWEDAFLKDNTQDREFYVKASESKQTPIMSQKETFAYYEDESLQAIDLPYQGGDLSMMVVLPQEIDGLNKVENAWNESRYTSVSSHLHSTEVQLYLPKFKLETSYTLKPLLMSMGMGLCFSNAADFTGMGKERLKISEVVHKAFVAVDEEGTEAAAATAVSMMKCTAMMPTARPKVFNANHPFLFFIRNRKTGTVLFSGRVTNPAG